MTRLTTIPISRASADQRAGRAGRTGPGTAWRTWSKIEHAARRPHVDPEITQVDLAGLALQLAAWGSSAADLAFLDPPPERSLQEGRELLRELRALDADGRITPAGLAMSNLPLHPRLACMVHAAAGTELAWPACLVASLLDDRDLMRGHPDEVPADLATRIAVLESDTHHPLTDSRSVRAARRRAADLARRLRVPPAREPIDPSCAGRLLALAYPDRLAQARGGRGRFRLRTGTGAWVRPADPLAAEAYVVAADLDGRRNGARIRLGTALDLQTLEELFGDVVDEHAALVWDRDRDDLVARTERRLDALQLGSVDRAPAAGPATAHALLERVRATRLTILGWTRDARSVQQRVAFLRRTFGARWPDLSDAALTRRVGEWLEPFLSGATGRADLERFDTGMAIRTLLPFDLQMSLDQLAPCEITLPDGTHTAVDYSGEAPVVAAKVQAFFGSTETPRVAGGDVPVVLHLLSPAGRPLQITSDLAGFWNGSWHQVRKEMAGRYPKHRWPTDPTAL